MDVTKATAYIPISRELAIEAGIIKPTPDEQTRLDAEHAKWVAWRHRQDALAARARSALAEITDPVARLVLDLHSEDSDGYCRECLHDDTYDWPCDTVRTIAGHFGIQVDEPYE